MFQPRPLALIQDDLSEYEKAMERMATLVEERQKDERPDTLWLLSHPPVFTVGKRTRAEHLPDPSFGIPVVPTNRGGQITYHGPGQLVVYPIVRLPRRDLRDWLRRFETFGIAVAQAFGVAAEASVDGTGVFAGGRKFASIGIAVKHWISLHGIGINVAMDLAPWHQVRPCGLSPDIMTDLSRASGRPLTIAAAVPAATASLSVLTDPDHPL